MRFRVITQHDAMQCGAACLLTVCQFYGRRDISLERMSDLCGVDKSGVSIFAINQAAQRILLARAFYRNPRLLILDEATNSLDSVSERRIVDNLASFCAGRTTIVIAHRLSTVRNADNIIVMDHGRIAEQGSHDCLTALRGRYYELIKNQLDIKD